MSEQPVAVHLSRDELREVISQGVSDAFTRLGIQIDDPISMQRDFQHLRDWRLAQEAMRSRGRMVMLTILVTGILSLIWVGLKDALHQLPFAPSQTPTNHQGK